LFRVTSASLFAALPWRYTFSFEDRMTIRTNLSRIGLTVAMAAALSACSTTPTATADKPKLQDLMSKADQAARGGNKEQAITLWKQSAGAAPADKAPWSHIAQTRYEAGQYGDAIQAALEVLVRDPNDTLANSIIAVSGLRLSTRALGDLSRQNNLSGSVRTESQDLAKLLRESLGESVLVPPPVVKPQAPAEKPAPRVARKAGRKGATVDGGASGASAAGTSANPFQALK
jgi:tetratricopeptide (TPR) repeat protein